ncbi:hypothetical protein HGRIS_014495 [Hohenbuehelia grisea]|uniref:lytic cellulose monooxygenase (C4-dehydrogenating) n=1 Tax=Hohenbuehelia grisea TaxID=104357 RepID=A0ABR3JVU2_9AGAR
MFGRHGVQTASEKPLLSIMHPIVCRKRRPHNDKCKGCSGCERTSDVNWRRANQRHQSNSDSQDPAFFGHASTSAGCPESPVVPVSLQTPSIRTFSPQHVTHPPSSALPCVVVVFSVCSLFFLVLSQPRLFISLYFSFNFRTLSRMKFSTAAVFLPLLAALPHVSAHGFVARVTIDGKSYEGNRPSGGNNPSPIRKISSQDPNYGANNPALNCGPKAKAGSVVADARPGSQLQFLWTDAAGGNWPHNTGPMITYLGSCGSTTADKCDSTKVKWFKIHQDGKKSNGQWVQADLMRRAPATAALPADLAPGNYLIRHEIIALHLASQGKAEFYPSCIQIKVGGNGKGGPSPNELISLPGGYSDNDAGIRLNPFSGGTYKFPGPNVVKLVTGAVSDVVGSVVGGSDKEPAPKAAKPASSAAAAATKPVVKAAVPSATPTPKASSKSCRQRKGKRTEPEPEDEEEDDEEETVAEVAARSPVTNETEITEETVNRVREFHAKRLHRVHKRTL